MRKIAILLLIAAAAFSCSKDDVTVETSTSTSEFENQNLQGKIEGVNWEFVSGTFKTTTLSGSETGFSVNMYPQHDTDLCSFRSRKWDRILFTCPATPGKYNLNFDLSNLSNARTITLYSERDQINNIATEGAYEIVSVDTAKGTMEIKINATADAKNSVNGKATLTYCK